MRFPNFDGKHTHPSLIEPRRYLEYMKARGQFPTQPPPEAVILCYQRRLLAHIKASHELVPGDGCFADLLYLSETQRRVAVAGNFGIGSPAAATVLEELIEFGAVRFVSIGTAGTLQRDIAIGDLVVCDKAIRDEGTSHHYIATDKYAHPSARLTRRVADALTAHGEPFRIGTSWTIDAPYRETIVEATHYRDEGVATVEMEAAALFAVAQYRGVELAAMFSISDSLADLEWRPEFHSDKTSRGLEAIYQAALAALVSPGS
jgi:uridine phosphorylase